MNAREFPRPTRLEIDPGAIAHNVRAVKAQLGERTRVMAVVKANGYGHGAVTVARAALAAGATWCGVAALTEALELRQAGIDAPILVMGYTPAWLAGEALANDIALTVYDVDLARAYGDIARALGGELRVHAKVDTGMGRLGVPPEDAPVFLSAVAGLPGARLEGAFTHFSCADTDEAFTREQLRRFEAAVRGALRERPLLLHAANSAAALSVRESHLDMIRLGIAMYGLNPFDPSSEHGRRFGAQSRPALAWKALVAQVKTLPDGAPVSYGATFRCDGERRIAVVPAGYADGLRRAPRHFGEALVRGARAPIVGRVCMDQTMIDVTHIPGVTMGDEVVLIGAQGAERITAEDVGARVGTINYEVTSAILARVPRVTVSEA